VLPSREFQWQGHETRRLASLSTKTFKSAYNILPVQYKNVGSQILKTVNTKITIIWCQHSAVGISTGCGLDSRGVRVLVPVWAKICFFSTSSRPALGITHPPIQEFRIFLEGQTSPEESTAIMPNVVEILVSVFKFIKDRQTCILPCRYKIFPFPRQYSILQLLYSMSRHWHSY
jgi:hypothetical protein